MINMKQSGAAVPYHLSGDSVFNRVKRDVFLDALILKTTQLGGASPYHLSSVAVCNRA